MDKNAHWILDTVFEVHQITILRGIIILSKFKWNRLIRWWKTYDMLIMLIKYYWNPLTYF